MISKIQKAVEVLNFYRNQHYNASSGTEEYEVANAINDILPLVSNDIGFEYDRSCPNCDAEIDVGWSNCPFCGQYVPK